MGKSHREKKRNVCGTNWQTGLKVGVNGRAEVTRMVFLVLQDHSNNVKTPELQDRDVLIYCA